MSRKIYKIRCTSCAKKYRAATWGIFNPSFSLSRDSDLDNLLVDGRLVLSYDKSGDIRKRCECGGQLEAYILKVKDGKQRKKADG